MTSVGWIYNYVKKNTGAHHVVFVDGAIDEEGNRANCLYIKSKEKELMFGGEKPLDQFTFEDIKQAIFSFNNLI